MPLKCSNYLQCIKKNEYKTALFIIKDENNPSNFGNYLSTLLKYTVNLTTTTYTNNENDIKALITYILSELKSLVSSKFFKDLDIKNCKTKTEGWVTNELLSYFISKSIFVEFYQTNKENQDDLNSMIIFFEDNINIGCVGNYMQIHTKLINLKDKLGPRPTPTPTPTSTPTPTKKTSVKGLKPLQIAGIASGGVLFLILLVVLIKFIKSKKKRKRKRMNNNNNINNRLKRL